MSDSVITEEVDEVKGLVPAITPETGAFWKNAREGRIVVDRCRRCNACFFPPRGWCATCMTAEYIDAAHQLVGPARLYSYTINYHSWLPAMRTPFVLGLAHFEEAPGVRIPCRVRTSDLNELSCDVLLDIDFESGPGGFRIPSFVVRSKEMNK